MTPPIEHEKAAFEQWFFKHREECRSNGIFLDTNDANSMWEGWQAALSQEAPNSIPTAYRIVPEPKNAEVTYTDQARVVIGGTQQQGADDALEDEIEGMPDQIWVKPDPNKGGRKEPPYISFIARDEDSFVGKSTKYVRSRLSAPVTVQTEIEREIETLCTELKCNIMAKRHSNGVWDMRIVHKWIDQPLLSVTGKASANECLDALNARLPAFVSQKSFIEKRNAEREKHFSKSDTKKQSHWSEWI